MAAAPPPRLWCRGPGAVEALVLRELQRSGAGGTVETELLRQRLGRRRAAAGGRPGTASIRAAAAAADAPKRPFFGSSSAKQAREQEEPVLSDLQPEAEHEDEEVPRIFDSVNHPPPGFHRDPAGSTVAAGHHHTCALRQSSAPFGGIAHCWGEDTMGAVSRVPVELTFIQLSSGHFHSCGITLDENWCAGAVPTQNASSRPGCINKCRAARSILVG